VQVWCNGDLSEFNIPLASEDGVDGPVIIDLPQADAASNNHAKRMLLRDVTTCAISQFVPRPVAQPLRRRNLALDGNWRAVAGHPG
jgi:serine/threonine-protein kinase RIO1